MKVTKCFYLYFGLSIFSLIGFVISFAICYFLTGSLNVMIFLTLPFVILLCVFYTLFSLKCDEIDLLDKDKTGLNDKIKN